MSIARLNGIRIHYEVHGGGFPLVFTHGFAGTVRSWDPQVPAFSPACKFITYDVRGHGQTTSPLSQEKYTIELVVEDLYRLLRHLNVEQAVVGGLSLGGYVSLKFFEKYKPMVKALILCDTGPGFRNPERMQEWNNQRLDIARYLEAQGIEAFANSRFVSTTNYTLKEVMLKHNPLGLAKANRGYMQDTYAIDVLPTVDVSTLILCGENDKAFRFAADYMQERIRGSEKVIIPNAGHAANVDQPEAFNRAVMAFLGEKVRI